MRLKNLMAPAMAAAVVLASHLPTVSAQEQEQRGRRGGDSGERAEGGRRFGGGFASMPGRGGPASVDQVMIGLLRNEAVREELKLDADQLAGLQKLAERQRPERPDFDFRSASESERTQFIAQMQKQAAERATETKAHLEELLLPHQMERLEQIALQVQGPAALLNPEVAKELGLTAAEVAKLSNEVAASGEKTREIMAAAMRERNFDGIREKAQEMRKELDEKLVAQLSSEQKAKFEALKGPAFDLPEPPNAFGRGRRGSAEGRPAGRDGDDRRGDRRQ